MPDNKTEPYNLAPDFERKAIVLTCTSAKFYGTIGYAMDPEALALAPAKLALKAARAYAIDNGHGPGDADIVIQRLSRWREEGKVTQEEIFDVDELLDSVPPRSVVEQDILDELVPIIRRRMEHEATKIAVHNYGHRAEMQPVTELLDKAKRLGKNDVSIGTAIGIGAYEELDRLGTITRLPTGILELDAFLDGGLPRKAFGLFVGGPGDGKSMALSHVTARLMVSGFSTLYATLELPPQVVIARILANITGVPINDIALPQGRKQVMAFLEQLGGIGSCFVKEFAPHATTTGDLRDWIKQCEDQTGRHVDGLFVDYADLMSAGSAELDRRPYDGMRIVYSGIAQLAKEQDLAAWSASQSRAREERDAGKKKRKTLDLQHLADSSHKGRIVDMAITLNLDEQLGIGFNVAKHRQGQARQVVGPLPCDFSVGQVAPVSRDFSSLKQRVDKAVADDAVARLVDPVPF